MDQLDELVQAHLATIQPYLHLISAGTTGELQPEQVPVGLEVQSSSPTWGVVLPSMPSAGLLVIPNRVMLPFCAPVEHDAAWRGRARTTLTVCVSSFWTAEQSSEQVSGIRC